MVEIGTWLSLVATAFGIIGAMAGAISWLSKKSEDRMGRAIKDALTPLTNQISNLNNNLNESKEDRKNIHLELEEHDDCIKNHDKRITVLEDIDRRKK